MKTFTKEQLQDLANALKAKEVKQTNDNALAKALDKRLNKPSAKAESKLQKAIAEHYPRVSMALTMKAVASTDPFSLNVELVLLPLDTPNKNKQAIPVSEADNILTTALYKPIRALFDGESVAGHAMAMDVGTITRVYRADNLIKADGVIWLEKHAEFGRYLQTTAEHKGSFEIYYESAVNRNGVDYLYGCIFAAQAFVENPAFSNTSIKINA